MFVARHVDLQALLAKRSLFLFGPRQTGKTSLIREQLATNKIFNLLETDTYLAMQRSPRRLRELCTERGELVVIDEIQKLPALLDEVHLLIEERRQRFLLTGSSARKLRGGGINLLGGRARSMNFHPLSAHEIGDSFDLATAIHNGLLPAIYFSDEPDADLRAYVGTYLREEIANEALTRNVPAFARFLEVAALCNAQQINYSKIASDAQVARTTVQEYFQILRDTLVGFDVPVWQRTRKRKAVATSKFYLFDPGVVRHLCGSGRMRAPSPEFGHAFESFICHEIKTWADYHGGVELSYWRSRTGIEVDFVLGGETAIEVKASEVVHERHLGGLLALREEGLLKRYILVAMEKRRRKVEGVEVLPWREFVAELWAGGLASK